MKWNPIYSLLSIIIKKSEKKKWNQGKAGTNSLFARTDNNCIERLQQESMVGSVSKMGYIFVIARH